MNSPKKKAGPGERHGLEKLNEPGLLIVSRQGQVRVFTNDRDAQGIAIRFGVAVAILSAPPTVDGCVFAMRPGANGQTAAVWRFSRLTNGDNGWLAAVGDAAAVGKYVAEMNAIIFEDSSVRTLRGGTN